MAPKVDVNLSALEVASLPPKEQAEYKKQIAMNRADDVQAGIEASMMDNEGILAKLRDKFNEGRERSGKLFKDLDGARDKYMTQSTNVWNTNRAFNNALDNYKRWNNANQGYLAFIKSGDSSDLSTFSGGLFGTPLTDINDSSRITNQGSFIGNRTEQYKKYMDFTLAKLNSEQDILAFNKEDRDNFYSELGLQLDRNRLLAEDMDFYTRLQAIYALYKNRQQT